MTKLKFQYDCVNPKSLEELNFILENSKEITYKTFASKVDKNELKELKENLGYTKDKLNISFKNDWSIQFYKSKTNNGKIVYYFSHSRIEHIFY